VTNATTGSLIATYAQPIADSAGLTATEYASTEEGLAALLRDAAEQLTPMDQTGQWLEDAATDLDAIARLGDDGPRTQKLLNGVDAALYEAKTDLELG
jgi:hypothetical protein